jgi:hypothetical protein
MCYSVISKEATMIGLYLLLGLTILSAGSLIYHSWRNGISPMPSSDRACDVMAAAAREEAQRLGAPPVRQGGGRVRELTVIEAGSGWGGAAGTLARRLPEARIIAYENSPLPFLVSLVRKRIAGCGNLEVYFRDFRREPLGEADILVCYLFPGGMRDIAALIDRPGGGPAVISNTFALPGRKPFRTISFGDAPLSPVYVYRPEPKDGSAENQST